MGWSGQPGWVISDLPPRLGPQNCLGAGCSVLVSQSRAVHQPISLTGKLKFTGVRQSSPSPWLSGEGAASLPLGLSVSCQTSMEDPSWTFPAQATSRSPDQPDPGSH